MKLSIISPVYRAEGCVRELYRQISEAAAAMVDFSEYEIIFVEDCGGDKSWLEICDLATSDPRLRAIKLSRNFGQHHAITAGIDLCDGDWAITLDCDLQDSPAHFSELWASAKEHDLDVVNARRSVRVDSRVKRLSSRLFHGVFDWLSGLSYDPGVANYRIISRRALDAYKTMRESTRVLGAQLQWLGFPTGYVDVPQGPRLEGQSSYTWRKLLLLAFEAAVSYSNKPLQISVGMGVIVTIGALVVSGWLLVRAFVWGIPVQGWASLMVSLWFLGGIVIANIGVVGLYVGKVYDEAKGRPIYAIARRVNC